GRVRERHGERGGGEFGAGLAAHGQRGNRLFARDRGVIASERGGHLAIDRALKSGRKQHGRGDQRGASGGAAPPGGRADARAKIGDKLEIGETLLKPLDQVGRWRETGTAKRQGRGPTSLLDPEIVAQKQGAPPPNCSKRTAADPRQGPPT